MKQGIIGLAIFGAVILTVMPTAVFADPAQVEAQIQATLERYMVAWNDADLEGVISLFSLKKWMMIGLFLTRISDTNDSLEVPD